MKSCVFIFVLSLILLSGCAYDSTRVLETTYAGKYRIDYVEREYGVNSQNLHYLRWYELYKRNVWGRYKRLDCKGAVKWENDTLSCHITFTDHNYFHTKETKKYEANRCNRTVRKIRGKEKRDSVK